MPVIHVQGRIMPQSYVLSVSGLPQFQMREEALNLSIVFTIVITGASFEVKCDLSEYTESLISYYIAKAHELVRTVVDTYSFAAGVGLTCFSDTFVGLDGVSMPIIPENTILRQLSTAIDLGKDRGNDLVRTLVMITSDSQIFMALNDLIVAITTQRVAEINCGRAIEALRHIMTPAEAGRHTGWEIMRNNLNISKKYISLITDNSQAGRHGDRTRANSVPVDEILKRSWEIMNRFLEYKKRSDRPLLITDFPFLDD